MRRGTRSKEEDLARNQVRSFCSQRGAKVFKTESLDGTPLLRVTECDYWPQGVITIFNGWRDSLDRLITVANDPELVTDGFYIQGDESFHYTAENEYEASS